MKINMLVDKLHGMVVEATPDTMPNLTPSLRQWMRRGYARHPVTFIIVAGLLSLRPTPCHTTPMPQSLGESRLRPIPRNNQDHHDMVVEATLDMMSTYPLASVTGCVEAKTDIQ